MARIVRQTLVVLILAGFCAGTALAQQPQTQDKAPKSSSEGISLDFKDVELAELIRVVSEMTGKNFLFDESLKGKVTIISPRPMSKEEAYQVFLSVLNVKGFTVVPSGGVNKVVALREAKESNLPTGTRRGISGEQYVTRLIPLRHIDAATLASKVLEPLIPKTSQVVAYAPSNTLIITDSAANIERLYRIIRELDVSTSSLSVEVISLDYASATEVAKICTQFLSQGGGAAARRTRGNVQNADTAQSQILAYVRTNALVVMATAEDLATVRLLVEQLDQQPEKDQSTMHVYYLENADAEELAKTLNEIVTGVKRVPATATPGAQQAKESLGAVTITADKPTNALVLSSTPEEYEVLRGIIEQLDVRRKQVFVEALILELSMDATSALGTSLQGAGSLNGDGMLFGTSNLNGGSSSLTSLLPAEGSSVPTLLGQSIDGILLGGLYNLITVDGPDGNPITIPALSGLIDASRGDSDINILSAPRLLTSDNEEAEIVVGENVPIITSRLTDTGSAGLAQSVSVERQDVALTLRFTPQVTEGDLVRLNVYQELTGVKDVGVGNVNEVGPTLTKRLLRNSVLAEDGRTVVLGGLIDTKVEESVKKVPLLGDIPLFGWLFKHKSTEETKTNLLVFITPHIVHDAGDLERLTRRSRELMNRFSEEEMGRTETPSAIQQELIDGNPAPEQTPLPEGEE